MSRNSTVELVDQLIDILTRCVICFTRNVKQSIDSRLRIQKLEFAQMFSSSSLLAYPDSISPLIPKIKWLRLISYVLVDVFSNKFLDSFNFRRAAELRLHQTTSSVWSSSTDIADRH